MLKLRPVDDQIVVAKDPAPDVSDGLEGVSIAIPECAQEKPCTGTVVAVGLGLVLPDGRRAPPVVKPGERVIFPRLAGAEIEMPVGEKALVVMREDEVFAVLEDESCATE